jgi:hypothetical protein
MSDTSGAEIPKKKRGRKRKKKLRIYSSSTSLRFYVAEGWTEKVLRTCLEAGDIKFCAGKYWELDNSTGALFDIDLLILHVSEVYTSEDKKLNPAVLAKFLRSLNGPSPESL